MSGAAVAGDLVDAFIRAACVPREDEGAHAHGAGTLEPADAILAAHPQVATASIHAAAVLGDDATVRGLLATDGAGATARGGPWGWDALTHLCFSRYLRLDRTRAEGFARAATALLDAGADPNTGFFEETHQPHREWESVLYGAAGIAHDPDLTRLLLERGADPNDGETPYHAPETSDNRAIVVLLESGRLTADSHATMLLRKADWHDYEGLRLLLEHGVDPNHTGRWPHSALHQAIRRDNALRNIELLLDHGADPAQVSAQDHVSAVELAARRGRADVLAALERRSLPIELRGLSRLLAACARGDEAGARALIAAEPDLGPQLLARGGEELAIFAGVGNADGVRLLLDLGVPVAEEWAQGDGYFGTPPRSTALHVAAWRMRHPVVELLLARGAPVDALDGAGRTPLQLAVRACVDSWWSDMRAPGSVAALLKARASVAGVPYPSGYVEVDELLRRHGAGGSP